MIATLPNEGRDALVALWPHADGLDVLGGGYATPYLDTHPRDWRLRYLIGTILAGLDENQAARREIERVLADNDRHAEAHYLLATLLRERFNDPTGADAHYRRYVEIEPAGAHVEEARAGMLRQVQK